MNKKLLLLGLVGAVLLSASPVLADGEFYVITGGGGVGTRITSLLAVKSRSGCHEPKY